MDLTETSKSKTSVKSGLSQVKEFSFEIPNVLSKKFNATDKSSPVTNIKFSGN